MPIALNGAIVTKCDEIGAMGQTMVFAPVRVSSFCLYGRPLHGCQERCQPCKPAQGAAPCDGLASGLRCGDVGSIWAHTSFNGDGAIPSRPHRFPTMTFLKISGVFLLPLLALFVGSLASEDQRHFLACRQTGASADACLLQISGR